jgi:ribonuclease HI
LGISDAIQAEVKGIICAIEIASSKGLTNFWLERDYSMTIQAFNNFYLVLWRLQNYVGLVVSI